MSSLKTILFFILILCGGILLGCRQEAEKAVDDLMGLDTIRTGQEAEKDLAIAQCQTLFQREKANGKDMASGPCLSDAIIPDWVCDVAHNPREAVDNNPINQCAAFHDGGAHHFVELDQNGAVIKTN